MIIKTPHTATTIMRITENKAEKWHVTTTIKHVLSGH